MRAREFRIEVQEIPSAMLSVGDSELATEPNEGYVAYYPKGQHFLKLTIQLR